MKVCIGTANFFNKYGVRNKEINDQDDILDYAILKGIEDIDYSFSYGTISESFIKKIKGNNLKIHLKSSITKSLNENKFIENILLLKNKLNDNNLVSLSIHDPWHINEKNIVKIKNIFIYLKSIIPKLEIGLSVYSKDDFKFLSKLELIEIVQLAYNPLQKDIFDYFINEVNTQNNIKLHVRSIFMQGLLISQNIQNYDLNSSLKTFHKKWINFVNGTKFSSKVICVDFIKKSNAENVIIGVDQKSHLEEFFKIFTKKTSISIPDFEAPLNVSDARYWVK